MTNIVKPPKPEIGLVHLQQVCTVRQAAYAWCRDTTTIKYSINRGYITAARIGRDWLIAIPSLHAHYGAPIHRIPR